MDSNRYCLVSGVLFALVALTHLSRILLGLPVQVDEFIVPMFFSWLGFALPAALAVWGLSIFRKSGTTR